MHSPTTTIRSNRSFNYSKKSSSIFLIYKVSSTLHPTLCRIMSLASCSPSISTILLLSSSAVSLAEDVKADVVTKIPFAALCRSRLPKKSRIALDPMLLPTA